MKNKLLFLSLLLIFLFLLSTPAQASDSGGDLTEVWLENVTFTPIDGDDDGYNDGFRMDFEIHTDLDRALARLSWLMQKPPLPHLICDSANDDIGWIPITRDNPHIGSVEIHNRFKAGCPADNQELRLFLRARWEDPGGPYNGWYIKDWYGLYSPGYAYPVNYGVLRHWIRCFDYERTGESSRYFPRDSWGRDMDYGVQVRVQTANNINYAEFDEPQTIYVVGELREVGTDETVAKSAREVSVRGPPAEPSIEEGNPNWTTFEIWVPSDVDWNRHDCYLVVRLYDENGNLQDIQSSLSEGHGTRCTGGLFRAGLFPFWSQGDQPGLEPCEAGRQICAGTQLWECHPENAYEECIRDFCYTNREDQWVLKDEDSPQCQVTEPSFSEGEAFYSYTRHKWKYQNGQWRDMGVSLEAAYPSQEGYTMCFGNDIVHVRDRYREIVEEGYCGEEQTTTSTLESTTTPTTTPGNNPPSVQPVTYTGSTNPGESLTLYCDASDPNQEDSTLETYFWIGKCRSGDCTAASDYDWYWDGRIADGYDSGEEKFYRTLDSIPWSQGTTVGATCKAWDEQDAESGWADAYPLFTVSEKEITTTSVQPTTTQPTTSIQPQCNQLTFPNLVDGKQLVYECLPYQGETLQGGELYTYEGETYYLSEYDRWGEEEQTYSCPQGQHCFYKKVEPDSVEKEFYCENQIYPEPYEGREVQGYRCLEADNQLTRGDPHPDYNNYYLSNHDVEWGESTIKYSCPGDKHCFYKLLGQPGGP